MPKPKPKRTRSESQDINQFAASVVTQSTEVPIPADISNKTAVAAFMREMGRRGGLKGGHARAAKLTPRQRTLSARKAANALWAKKRQTA
jgi:hypothetical protein